jgi:hypothetical protein
MGCIDKNTLNSILEKYPAIPSKWILIFPPECELAPIIGGRASSRYRCLILGGNPRFVVYGWITETFIRKALEGDVLDKKSKKQIEALF